MRVAREASCQSFDNAARALNEDWGTNLDGKQVQRWAQRLGQSLVERQRRQVEAYERGELPLPPPNGPQLLVIGMDGGRVQGVEKNAESGSRWKEDKVLTVSSYLKGDADRKPPTALVSTYVATMADAGAFGPMARVESERRGLRQAVEAVVIGDGGNWIDPLCQRHFPHCPRIIDYYHAVEHLHESARAASGEDAAAAGTLGGEWKDLLYDGKVGEVIDRLKREAGRLGEVQEGDAPGHPRRVLARDVGYFSTHAAHMDYPAYRTRGWPIGSGLVESGVKLMNKRVKGTEQFWREQKVETILALRCLWLSQDQRWQHYWLGRERQAQAA
jgi:hypothetical protein